MTGERTFLEFGRVQAPEDWIWPILAGLLLVGLVAFLYRRDTPGKPTWLRALLIGIRALVYFVLLWVALEPRRRTESTARRNSRVLVAVDRSLSMTLEDESIGTPPSRASRHARLVEELQRSRLIEVLRQRHDVVLYGMGSQIERLGLLAKNDSLSATQAAGDLAQFGELDWGLLTPRDQESRLGAAGPRILEREADHPVAGLVLLSDGRATEEDNANGAVEWLARAGVPVFAVGLGSEEMPVNARLANLRMPARAFPNDEVRITAEARGTKVGGEATIALTIEDQEGKEAPRVLETRRVPLPPDGSPVPIEFKFLPDRVGSWRLALKVDARPGEIRVDDNVLALGLEVIDKKTKVLLVAGGPGREYQFLRDLLHRDRSIELSVLLQSARETISQDAARILREFPTEREDWFAHDLVIAIDVDWTELPPAGQHLFEEWVSQQAGGVIFFAGPIHTPRLARDETLEVVRQLIPVALKEVFTSELEPGAQTQPWPIALTPEGTRADFLRLADDPAESERLWKEFAGFYWSYPISGVKPGAGVLADFSDPRAATRGLAPPIFATQFFGAGRVLYVGSAELWRLRRLGVERYERLAIRLAREFAQGRLQGGTGRLALLLDGDHYSLPATIPIQARVLDTDYRPLLANSLPLKVTEPSGTEREIALEPCSGQPGRYQAVLVATEPGEVRLRLAHPGRDEAVERRISVMVPDLEFADPRADHELLRRTAGQTKGLFVPVGELARIPPRIEDRTEIAIISGTPESLWDRGWVMLAVVGLLGTEWFLRRWHALS